MAFSKYLVYVFINGSTLFFQDARSSFSEEDVAPKQQEEKKHAILVSLGNICQETSPPQTLL